MGGKQERPPGRGERSAREFFEGCLSGAFTRPYIPRLRSDPSSTQVLSRSLDEFRNLEGPESREKRLHAVWKRIPHGHKDSAGKLDAAPSSWAPASANVTLTREKAENLTAMYHNELLKECAWEDGDPQNPVTWKDFKKYADYKEAGAQSECFISHK